MVINLHYSKIFLILTAITHLGGIMCLLFIDFPSLGKVAFMLLILFNFFWTFWQFLFGQKSIINFDFSPDKLLLTNKRGEIYEIKTFKNVYVSRYLLIMNFLERPKRFFVFCDAVKTSDWHKLQLYFRNMDV